MVAFLEELLLLNLNMSGGDKAIFPLFSDSNIMQYSHEGDSANIAVIHISY